MNNGQSAGYEHQLMLFYIRHVVVTLPLTILGIKVIVRFFTREPPKDIFRSLLVLPLDLIYIAFGLLLAGVARLVPAFASHYHTDKEADFAGVAFSLALFGCACLITWSDRFVRLLWQKFYAAWNLSKQIQNDEQQLLLPGQPMIRKVAVIYLWMFTYWAMMIPLIFFEAILSVEALGSILKRLQ